MRARKRVERAARDRLALVPARFRKANMVETGREIPRVFAICYLLSKSSVRSELRSRAEAGERNLGSQWIRPSSFTKVAFAFGKALQSDGRDL